ncbi:MAG: hypothetical protein R3203_06725 [Pseudoalteromonas tetraodonis]|nr:hypothetical protein [Pseudoalteromonas tetraodonis]
MKKYAFILLLVGLSGCKSLSGLPPVVDLNKLVKQVKNDPTNVVAIHKQAQKHSALLKRKWGKQNTQQPSAKIR